MSDSLSAFASHCHDILTADPGPAGREKVRDALKELLVDDGFVAKYLANEDAARKLLYEDPELKFCIFAHSYKGQANSKPHDHGPAWAIYGQAVGETLMSEWKVTKPTEPGDDPGEVKLARDYTMRPGDAYLYNEGEVHSPARNGDTRLVRIEGINMDGVPRRWYKPPES